MNLNIVLDINIVLDLILKRPPATLEKLSLFSRFKKQGARFHFPACGLSSPEYIHSREIGRLIREDGIRTNGKILDTDRLRRIKEAIKVSCEVQDVENVIWH
jgi:hypothetical protein